MLSNASTESNSYGRQQRLTENYLVTCEDEEKVEEELIKNKIFFSDALQ